MSDDNKCGHIACNCPATGESKYCSDHCREAVDQDLTEIACSCGHGGCD